MKKIILLFSLFLLISRLQSQVLPAADSLGLALKAASGQILAAPAADQEQLGDTACRQAGKVYQRLLQAALLRGDFRQAFLLQSRFIQWKDSLNEVFNRNRLARLRLGFSADSLSTRKQMAAQEERIRNLEKSQAGKDERNQLIFLVSAIAWLLVLVLVIIALIRKKAPAKEPRPLPEKASVTTPVPAPAPLPVRPAEKKIQPGAALLTRHLPDCFIEDNAETEFFWALDTDEGQADSSFIVCGCANPLSAPALREALNEAVGRNKLRSPDQVKLSLQEKTSEKDLFTGFFDLRGGWFRFVCGQSRVFLIRKGELKTFSGEGLQTLGLRKGDCLYFLIGEALKNTERVSELEELLLANHSVPMAGQKKRLEETANGLKKHPGQGADFLLAGIRI